MAKLSSQAAQLQAWRGNFDAEDHGDVHGRIFTKIMISINIGVFIWSMYLNEWQFEYLSVNPTLGPSISVLDDLGAKNTVKIVQDGEWHRLITPMFLHSGLIHIAFNMLLLWRIGGSIEETFGYFRIAIVYLVSGIGGVLASCVFLPATLGVGASGALYGLIGALFGEFLHNWKAIQNGRIGYMCSLFLNTAIGLIIGLMPIIDNFAHFGGAITGFFLGSLLLVLPRSMGYDRPWYSGILRLISYVALFVWIGSLIFFLLLDKDANEWCSWCHYLSCVDTPWWDCSCWTIGADGIENTTC